MLRAGRALLAVAQERSGASAARGERERRGEVLRLLSCSAALGKLFRAAGSFEPPDEPRAPSARPPGSGRPPPARS